MLLEQVVIKTGTFKYHLLDCNGEGPDKWRSVSVKLVDVAFSVLVKMAICFQRSAREDRTSLWILTTLNGSSKLARHGLRTSRKLQRLPIRSGSS